MVACASWAERHHLPKPSACRTALRQTPRSSSACPRTMRAGHCASPTSSSRRTRSAWSSSWTLEQKVKPAVARRSSSRRSLPATRSASTRPSVAPRRQRPTPHGPSREPVSRRPRGDLSPQRHPCYRGAAPPMPAHAAAFTFDIEDWFHSEFVPDSERRASPESVVERGTTRILDLLRASGARATFFLLGDVVRAHPALVRRIADEGHEVASHGLDHRPLWRLDPDGLARQLDEFRGLVERVLGRFPVV